MSYLQALTAYALWGVFPLYWKYLHHVDAVEIICHRIVWSLATLILCVSWMGQWQDVRDAIRSPSRLAMAAVAALLISTNWLVFIWGVLNGSVVDVSLGYFITPMFSVILGMLVFRERLVPIQGIAASIPRNVDVVTLTSAQVVTRRALLQSLLYELHLPCGDGSEGVLRLTLLERLQS
ncbi:MAG: EamA family transporter, partial [Planctomycetota bacterium]